MLNAKKYREKMGLSQAEVARRIGVSRQTYNNYELGKREADYETLLKLAEELNTSVQALLSDDKENSTPIPKDRSAVIERINALPNDQFEKFAAKVEGYLDGLEDQ